MHLLQLIVLALPTMAAWADSCTVAPIQAYLDLGFGGCTVGPVTFSGISYSASGTGVLPDLSSLVIAPYSAQDSQYDPNGIGLVLLGNWAAPAGTSVSYTLSMSIALTSGLTLANQSLAVIGGAQYFVGFDDVLATTLFTHPTEISAGTNTWGTTSTFQNQNLSLPPDQNLFYNLIPGSSHGGGVSWGLGENRNQNGSFDLSDSLFADVSATKILEAGTANIEDQGSFIGLESDQVPAPMPEPPAVLLLLSALMLHAKKWAFHVRLTEVAARGAVKSAGSVVPAA